MSRDPDRSNSWPQCA